MALLAGDKVLFRGVTFFEDRQWSEGVLLTGIIEDPDADLYSACTPRRGYRIQSGKTVYFVYAGEKNIRRSPV